MRRPLALVVAGLLAVAVAACAGDEATSLESARKPSRTTTTRRTTSTTVNATTTTTLQPATTTTAALTTTTRAAPATTTTAPPAGGCSTFPTNNPWNTDISGAPVSARSGAYVASIGASGHLHPDFGTTWDGALIGIPFVHVGAGQAKVPVSFEYDDESDSGPYPIPANAPIEGGSSSDGDRHVLVVDDSACKLYELFGAYPQGGGSSWTAGSGAVFDLRSNALRPDGWTSADAAGLPIYPGLIRYDEVVQKGVINHALRFTISRTQRGYIHPATHFASAITDPDVAPMGARFRMKASYSCAAFSQEVEVICAAMKRYGMFVADNGSDWYVSGAHDPRWNDDALNDLKQIPGSAFEVVESGTILHQGG
jgi:hypothetical protein